MRGLTRVCVLAAALGWTSANPNSIDIDSQLDRSNEPHLSTRSLVDRAVKESEEEYKQTKASFEQNGGCMSYFDDSLVAKTTSTCEVYCHKDNRWHGQANCKGSGKDISWYKQNEPTLVYIDPDGDVWVPGKCDCFVPGLSAFADELVSDIGKGLQKLDAALCGPVAKVIVNIVDEGIGALPVGDVVEGVSTAARAARTILENGVEAAESGGVFTAWFSSMCGKDMGFDPVEAVADLAQIPLDKLPGESLGCFRKSKKDCKKTDDDDTKPTNGGGKQDSKPPTKPNDTKPTNGGGKPGSKPPTKPNDTKPNDTKPNDTKPNDTKPNDTKPNDTKPNDTKPTNGGGQPGSKPPTKPNDTKPDDTKPTNGGGKQDSKPQPKPNDTKPTNGGGSGGPDSKPQPKPNDTKPTKGESDSKPPTNPTNTKPPSTSEPKLRRSGRDFFAADRSANGDFANTDSITVPIAGRIAVVV